MNFPFYGFMMTKDDILFYAANFHHNECSRKKHAHACARMCVVVLEQLKRGKASAPLIQ